MSRQYGLEAESSNSSEEKSLSDKNRRGLQKWGCTQGTGSTTELNEKGDEINNGDCG